MRKHIKVKKILLPYLVIILSISSCNNDVTTPLEEELFTYTLKESVVLENQSEYSNALVFIDKINKGVSSDSSGNYSFDFKTLDSTYSRIFKIYYFLMDYNLDSAYIVLVNGKVKLDSLDVDKNGRIAIKELNQIILVEGWTDKKKYNNNEKLLFALSIKNLSTGNINLFIPSSANSLSTFLTLYNNEYNEVAVWGSEPILTNTDITLDYGNIFKDSSFYNISEFVSLKDGEYIVDTPFYIEKRLIDNLHPKYPFEDFINKEWYKIHRGSSPCLDWYPNKYHLPIITISNSM